MAKNYENKEPEVLAAWYSDKAFVKIKQVLDIGKILFSFVNKEKPDENIDCYLTAEEFGALLMADIKNRLLFKQLSEEKAKGEQYPKAIWTSPIGGSESGGKTISRYFNIAPGSKSEVVITALCFPADKNATGAYIQKKGVKALITLRVPCTYNDLKILQYKWSFLENDYMSEKYSVANTTSTYNRKQKDTNPKESSSSSDKNTNPNQTQSSTDTNAASEDGTNSKPPEQPKMLSDTFKTKNNIADRKAGGMYLYACRKNDEKPIAVVFLNEQTKAYESQWNEFREKTMQKTGIQFRINYTEKNGICYFLGFL